MNKVSLFKNDVSNYTKTDYQSVFNSEQGVRVLTHMLNELNHFAIVSTPEEIALQNYAKRLLHNIGKWDVSNMENITRSYMAMEDSHEVYVGE